MTTVPFPDTNPSPDLVLSREEYDTLVSLAMASADDMDWLLSELERAQLVPDDTVPPDVVRMGSTVRYRPQDGDERTVQVVFPKEADIASNKVSVLTPIGGTLIGLRIGQRCAWQTRDGRKQILTILWVAPPQADDPGPAAA